MKTIVVMRHGNKDGEALSALGAMQVFAAVWNLVATLGYNFYRIVYSGIMRTWQSTMVAQAALRCHGDPLPMNGDSRFCFEEAIRQVYGGSREEFDAGCTELRQLAKDKVSVGHVLAMGGKASRFAQIGREAVTAAILDIAGTMKDGESVLVLSHSGWLELASADQNLPFAIGEADALVYTVVGNHELIPDAIEKTELIKAPPTPAADKK